MPTLYMPPGGSVNQIEPSDFTTISFGVLSFLPCHLSASVFHEPSCSWRNTVRPPQPATRMRFSRSSASPLAFTEGVNSASLPTPGFQLQMVSPMMSVNTRRLFFLSHTGPSPKIMSRAHKLTGGLLSTMRSHPGAHISTSTYNSSNDPCIDCSFA